MRVAARSGLRPSLLCGSWRGATEGEEHPTYYQGNGIFSWEVWRCLPPRKTILLEISVNFRYEKNRYEKMRNTQGPLKFRVSEILD